MYNIYKLLDPITKELVYIGVTTKSIYQRLAGHIHEAYHRNRHFCQKQDYIKQLFEQGLVPLVELIENTDDINREKYWIDQYKPKFNLMFNFDSQYANFISNMKSIEIYQYDLDGTFIQSWKSSTEAAKRLNLDTTNICSAISGKRRQCGGFMWKSYKVSKTTAYKKVIYMKPVYMYDKSGNYLKEFPSARHVGSGFSFKCISRCCNGDLKSHKGYKFSFEKHSKI